MRVKIGETIYDSEEQPIMIVMDEDENFLLRHMEPEATRFLSHPETMSVEDAEQFMKLPGDEEIIF